MEHKLESKHHDKKLLKKKIKPLSNATKDVVIVHGVFRFIRPN